MASSSSSKKYRFPLAITSDEEEDYCRVCVVVKGIKKPTSEDKSNPANGKVKLDLKERSLDIRIKLDLEGKKDKNGQPVWERFRYKVKRLPDYIIPSESPFKIKKDQVVILLKKKVDRSWQTVLTEGGLETSPSSDESASEEDNNEGNLVETLMPNNEGSSVDAKISSIM